MRLCFALLILFPVLMGCEEDVAAPSRLDEAYSMFGIINPRLDTQSVVVSPIEPLLFDYPDSIDAAVTLTDLASGETTTLRDTTMVGERGQRDFAFLAAFRPEFGGSYRVDVARSDGAVTSAVANVPPEVDVTYDDSGSHIAHVSVVGDAFHLLSIDVLYTIRFFDTRFMEDPCDSPAYTYAIPYTHKESGTEDGYRLAVDVAHDHSRVMALYSADRPIAWRPLVNGFALMQMGVRLLVGEEAWDPPGGTFDENALAHPDIMTNVENGYGFVGGGYNHDGDVVPSEDVVDATLFFDFVVRPGEGGDEKTCADYCGCDTR